MIIDIIVVAVLLISAIIAFLRGLIREVLTIAGVGGGLFAAYVGGPVLNPQMRDWLGVKEGEEIEKLFGVLPYDVVAIVLSYGLVFIVVVIILSVISHFLAESIKKLGLGAVDRTFGFIFGLLRGVLLLGLLYLPAYLFIDTETKDTYMEGSKTRFYLEKTSEAIAGFIPESATEEMGKNAEELSKTLSAGEGFKEIDLLKEHRERMETDESADENGGYDAEFRDKMDQLFEDKTDTESEQGN